MPSPAFFTNMTAIQLDKSIYALGQTRHIAAPQAELQTESTGQTEKQPHNLLPPADRSAASPQSGKKFPIILVGICALGLTAAGVILFSFSILTEKKKEDLLLRRKRRLERLEDIGYSSSDFDQLLSQKRSSAPSYKKQNIR